MVNRQVEILDTTLRDGAQGEGISFSVQDKITIVKSLDQLGISLIEAGNPGSNPKDMEFFSECRKLKLNNSKIVAFGSTRRKDLSCDEDSNLQSLLAANTDAVVVFGKTWKFQATDILHVKPEDNLAMIKDTVSYLAKKGRRVIFDAEHFFTGYQDDPSYAMDALEAAANGGADTLVLCETKGGTLCTECYNITKNVVDDFGQKCKIGIHTHNDSGLAVANTLMAVEAGATHVQGTILGFGERTGNANLSTIIPDLQLKMGYSCIPENLMSELTHVCNRIAEVSNISLNANMPYVGKNAFAHKAGMHIDAILKNPLAYEHTSPESVGNQRVFLMSDAAGRSMVMEKIRKFTSPKDDIKKDSPVVNEIIGKVKDLEKDGYQFEGADGSFELLVRKIMGKYNPFFKLCYYKTSGDNPRIENNLYAFAQLKIQVGNHFEMSSGEGNGPVNALDSALRGALKTFYPSVTQIRLVDYKVRVLDGKNATASRVRVLIDSTDGEETWSTVGVSCDIVEASWLALVDSFEYKLLKDLGA